MGTMTPDEAMLRRHLEVGAYLSSALAGRWGVTQVAWPYVIAWVRARDGVRLGLRLECSDYPQAATTGQPWDIAANQPLPHARWPKGHARIPMAFNPNWNASALYLPCDRTALAGHENWRNEHPCLLWNPDEGLVCYLRVVFDLLNSGDYIDAMPA